MWLAEKIKTNGDCNGSIDWTWLRNAKIKIKSLKKRFKRNISYIINEGKARRFVLAFIWKGKESNFQLRWKANYLKKSESLIIWYNLSTTRHKKLIERTKDYITTSNYRKPQKTFKLWKYKINEIWLWRWEIRRQSKIYKLIPFKKEVCS